MNNVIFLDIDGVLTSFRQYHGTGEIGGIWSTFDPVAVQFLNSIHTQTKAKLCISSSWRLQFDKREMHFILAGNGLRIPFFDNKDWCTPLLSGQPRGDEISQWLYEKEVDNYIIFDDEADAGVGHKAQIVRTDGMNGLLYDHIRKAKGIIGQWK